MMTILLFLICLRTVHSSLVAAPRNTVVVAGQRMEMECKTNRGTKVHDWTIERPFTSVKPKIFSNYETEPNRIDPSFKHFGADVDSNGSGIIYSNETRSDDAGIYTCRVKEGQRQPVPYSAQVIVLETNPFCETIPSSDRKLTDNDKIWFKCSVNFTGNWAPTMEWRQHCRDKTTVLTDGFVTTISTNSSMTSTLSLTIHSSDSECNLSCKIYFSSNTSITNDVATATNIPDYSDIWDFSKNQVLHQVTILHSEMTDTTVSTVIDTRSSESSRSTELTTMDPPGEDKEDKAVKTALIVVLIVVGLVVAMVVVCCLCCACYKKKITEFLIQMAANAQGGSVNSNHQKRLSRSKIPLPRPPNGYTPVQIRTAQSPTLQESKKVQLTFMEEPGRTTEAGAVGNEIYNIVKDEQASTYATLSRGIEPPKADNVYAKKGHSFYDGRAESTYDAIHNSFFMETPVEVCAAENTCAKASGGPCVDGVRVEGTGAKTTGGSCSKSTTAESTRFIATGDVGTRIASVESASSSIYDEATGAKHVESIDITYSAVSDIETSSIYDKETTVNHVDGTDATTADSTYSAVNDIDTSSIYDEATDIRRVKSTDSTTTDSTYTTGYSAITDSVYAPNTDSMYAVVNDV